MHNAHIVAYHHDSIAICGSLIETYAKEGNTDFLLTLQRILDHWLAQLAREVNS